MMDPFTILNIYPKDYYRDSKEIFASDFQELIENNLDKVNNHWEYTEEYAELKAFSCFDPYWELELEIDSGEDFYFGFTFLPIWYKKVVEEFNSLFKNIKIEILYEKLVVSEVTLVETYWGYTNKMKYNTSEKRN